ncbi:glycoside hydrolase family 44 protein [Paraburkholderia sp. BCC1885]|uniref:glycoside hydrolase family 44 protein n=1 Tax=Paraburkholderia sp. BCC1885 TaxID=2562669 RepID=UPI001182788F|nr:glycoside hydrolase family 44 protein [Paraburkholderia sp. BCC1885]
MSNPARFNRRTLLATMLGSGALMCAHLLMAAPLPVTITVNAAANRHPISPLIYGLNFGTADILRDLRVPINRSGGNTASTYNWRIDAHNTGQDWFFESVPVDPKGIYQYNERFIDATREAHATPMLTIPMIGRVARLDRNGKPLASFSVSRYGKQQAVDAHGLPDAGNGIALDGTPIKNDPDDASMLDDPQSQQERINQLVHGPGRAAPEGSHYYMMDNEPSLWHVDHRDIHPIGEHAGEIASKVIAYSRALKTADPAARIVAPEEWGWTGYRYSGFDQQYLAAHGAGTPPDRANETHGMDYVPWLLAQWKQAGHPVDVFSLHFYPQGGEFTGNEAASATEAPAVELARNRSTRDLWDTSYKDPTWINSVIALIPLMRQWVDTWYYPGTPVALTEYSWGGDMTMNGATAQADVLGIFGREGLDIATRWGVLNPDMPVYKAIKLYRNYDGQGSGFGTTSVADTQPDPDQVSSFAALRDHDHVMTIVVINKQLDQAADATIAINNFDASQGKAETWQLMDNAITRQHDTDYASGKLHLTLPPKTVTLLVLHGAGG